ncbi:hypothetical protein ACER0C_017356 [Sarotherodon galilaeus]
MEETDLYLVEWRQGAKRRVAGLRSPIKIAEREKNLQIKLFTLVIYNNYQNLFTFNLTFTEIPPLLLATEHLLTKPMKSHADLPDMSKSQPHAALPHPPKYYTVNLLTCTQSTAGGAGPRPGRSFITLPDSYILFCFLFVCLFLLFSGSMVRVLLMAAFPLEVLIHSNLKVAVRKRFPNVSRGALGIAVNSKLGELRPLEKKKKLHFNVKYLLLILSSFLKLDDLKVFALN